MSASRILTALLAVAALAACSSTPDQPKHTFKPRTVTIRTDPPGAQVMQYRPFGLKSENLGITPIVGQEVLILTNADMMTTSAAFRNEALDHAGNLVVLIRKDGFRSRKMKLPIKGSDAQEFDIRLDRP